MATFAITFAQNLALTVPPNGASGPVSLTPLANPADPRQQFVKTGRKFSQVNYPQKALGVVTVGNDPIEGNALAIDTKTPAYDVIQKFGINNGVVTLDSNEDLTLGFGVVLTTVGSDLAKTSGPSPTATVTNKSGGDVYISQYKLPHGDTAHAVVVEKGKILYAVDSKGNVLAPTPVVMDESRPIELGQSLTVTIYNKNVKADLRSTTGAMPLDLYITNEPLTLYPAFGTVYEAYDKQNNQLYFVNLLNGDVLEDILIHNLYQHKYQVVVPVSTSFTNALAESINLNYRVPHKASAQAITSVTIGSFDGRFCKAAPGTEYTATSASTMNGNLTFTNQATSAVTPSATASVPGLNFSISRAPTVPSVSVTLINYSAVSFTVSTQTTPPIQYSFIANNPTPQTHSLPQGVILRVDYPNEAVVAPLAKQISVTETITYTAGVMGLTPAQKVYVNQWLPSKTFTLRYRASRDGWSAANFHSLCDGQGPTFTIITTGTEGISPVYKFGGYTPDNWGTIPAGHLPSPSSFLFSLANPTWAGSPVKIIRLTTALVLPTGIYASPANGPTFGGGNDIRVTSYASTEAGSYSNFPYSYGPDPSAKGNAFFAGTKDFLPTEVEVYRVV